MRIRIYSPFLPFPFSEAAFQLIFNQAHDLIRLGHTVELVIWKNPLSEMKSALGAHPAAWSPALVITHLADPHLRRANAIDWLAMDVPKTKKARRFDRMMRVARSLWSSGASPELYYYPPQLDRRIELPDVDLEIYHYSFSHVWLERERRGRVPRQAIYFHNIESDLFFLRAQNAPNPIESSLHTRTAQKLREHEIELTQLGHECWFITAEDRAKLESELSERLLPAPMARVVGPTVASALYERRRHFFLNSAKTEKIIGFIGGLDFEPNIKSMQWILDRLAPELASLQFKGRLIHVGKRSPDLEERARKFKFIEFQGFVDDIEAWWASLSYSLVPDVTGAGVRVKLLESVASGVPVFATHMAANRVHPLVQASPLLVASDDPREWADRICRESAFETRGQLIQLPLNEGLTGERVYRFLDQS